MNPNAAVQNGRLAVQHERHLVTVSINQGGLSYLNKQLPFQAK